MKAETSRAVSRARAPLVALVAGLLAASSGARSEQSPTPQTGKTPPPITFGVQVNYVEVDAIVTDREGNAVRDLTRDDFEIREDGKPHPVELLVLVNVPPPVTGRPARRVVPSDVRTNQGHPEGRLYVIVLDDLHTAAMRSNAAKQAARRFLERYFGDGDVGAVVHTSGRSDASQDLTGERGLLLAAVDRFMGRKLRSATLNRIDSYNMASRMGGSAGSGDIDEQQRGYYARSALAALRDVASALTGIRRQRKALLFVSEGIDYDVENPFVNRDAVTIRDATREAIDAATRSNTSIYSIDPRGLHVMGDEAMEMTPVMDPTLGLDSSGLWREQRLAETSLRELADATVGRAAVSTNDLDGALDQVVKDQSAYYLLGYRPASEKQDGRFHKLSVRVLRPGLTVRARPGYWAQRKSASKGKEKDAALGALHGLLAQPVQESALPLSIHAAAFRGTYANEAAVMVTVEVGAGSFRFVERNGKFQDRLDLAVSAVDTSGKASGKGTGTDTGIELDLLPETRRAVDAAGFRAVVALDLKPGRYQLRAAARAANAGATGSVFCELEVPDFRDAPLSLSGVAVSSAAASAIPTAGTFELLKGVLPAPATTLREFSPRDTLAVAAEVYDTETKVAHTVDVTTSVSDEAGVVAFRSEQRQETGVEGGLRPFAFTHKALVPLKGLSPGRHVLRVEARSRLGKGALAAREVAFSVVAEPGSP